MVAKQFGRNKKMEYMVKAQVLGGGRGMGHFKENNFHGGVHKCRNPEEVKEVAEKMCGKTLITKQSGEIGFPCNCVYIVERLDIEKEYYLSLILDRKEGCPVFIYSSAGGMSIEDVAHTNPEKIHKIPIDINKGVDIEPLLKACSDLGLDEHKSQMVFLFKHLYDCFLEKDCELIEINPVALTREGSILAADSKIVIDDNAMFR